MAFSFELNNGLSSRSGAAAYSESGSRLCKKANVNQGQVSATELTPSSQFLKSLWLMVTDARTHFLPLLLFLGDDQPISKALPSQLPLNDTAP